MKEKRIGTGILVTGAILLTLVITACPVHAKESTLRSGVVIAITPNLKTLISSIEIQEETIVEVAEAEPEVIEEAEEIEAEPAQAERNAEPVYTGARLNKRDGVCYFDGHKETYYNLPMGGVIRLLNDSGISHGEYWVRDDGCKMLGDYIIVAADTRRIPKGTIIETSLGMAMVCDHCGSSESYDGVWVDIAVNW